MGILKDWKEDTEGYRFQTRVAHLFYPRQWLRLHKWRKQRANRGWSDRDTWGAGDHIAEITAQMLQKLITDGHCDWPYWFKMNVKEEGKGAYKNLQQVVDDINQYIEMTKTSWADDLECEGNMFEEDEGKEFKRLNTTWRYKKNGRKLSEQQISARIKSWAEKENASYKKAQKAMQFFGRHFAGFWD